MPDLTKYIEDSYKTISIEAIIEEIEFAKEICGTMNPCWGIPLDRLYLILNNNIPEFKNYFNGEITRNNKQELASLLTTTV